ncbi:MAG: hypothetical protein CL927_10140 [Deltaproteobacteria bacterium]|nr:hypothetical protein [Deltaproteobacteria bacterium]HCH62993.1 hypothetical protein [Deltaproteobacteria bacterium]
MADAESRADWWSGALVAGVFGGLGEGIAATRHLLLATDPVRDIALLMVSLGAGLVVAVGAAAALPWLARAMGRPWPEGRWTGFVCGAMAWTVLCGAAFLPGWFSVLPLLGFAALPSFVRREKGRPRMIVGLGFLALLAVRIADDHRPRDRAAPPVDPGPDVVVVVVDGLRADQLGRRPKGDLSAMPQLEALASSGVRFTTVAAPVSTKSGARDAVITGVPPWTSPPRRGWADELTSAGWRTAVFGGPEVDSVAREVGFGVVDTDPGWLAGAPASAPGLLWVRLADSQKGRRSARRLVEAWARWVDVLPSERPAVSFLHLTDLTWPAAPTPPWDTAFESSTAASGDAMDSLGRCSEVAARAGQPSLGAVRAAYDGASASVDALLPDIWSAASQRPRGAVVFVVGSRGTPFGEEARWLGTGGAVHPADVQVVLTVFGADAPKGSTLGAPISTVDVVATIRARAALEPVSDARPIPGVVRGYPPREVTHAVGADGSVLALSADHAVRRSPEGSVTRLEGATWVRADTAALPPVPVLPPVAAEEGPCGAEI